MDLQVRLSYDTANLLEEIKKIYEKSNGIYFTKGDVVSKAMNDFYDLYESIHWSKYSTMIIKIKDNNIAQGALRPKLQLSKESYDKIVDMKNRILKESLDVRHVTFGVVVSLILKLAYTQINNNIEKKGVEDIILSEMEKYISNETAEVTDIIKDYTKEIIESLNNNLLK